MVRGFKILNLGSQHMRAGDQSSPSPSDLPTNSVLNAATRLIARLPRFSHISTFMAEQLHWLPLSARIQFKVLIVVLKSQLGLAPK